jgi:hypothetical protein
MDAGLVPDCSIFGSAVRENTYHGSRLPEIHVNLKVKPAIYEILAVIRGKCDADIHEWVKDDFRVRATLPLVLVAHVLPQCIAEFRSCKKGQCRISICSFLTCSYAFSQVPL